MLPVFPSPLADGLQLESGSFRLQATPPEISQGSPDRTIGENGARHG